MVRCVFMVCVLCASLAMIGCATTARTDADASVISPAQQRQAIRAVLATDERIAAVRNRACENAPLHEAIDDYVNAMRQVDLSRTPADFRRAFTAHIDAWDAMIPYLARHADRRGEMHELFEWLRSRDNSTADAFIELEQAMWDSWTVVEASLARHGLAE